MFLKQMYEAAHLIMWTPHRYGIVVEVLIYQSKGPVF